MDTNWSADHIRVSLFSNKTWSSPAEDVFSNVFGSDPETITKKTSSNDVSMVGVWNEMRVDVKISFNRIDFIVQRLPTEIEPISLIKDVKLVLPMFSSVIGKWATTQTHELMRIALGCNALLLSKSIEDNYLILKKFIKVIDVDVHRFKDFIFQVNLPKTSSVSPDLIINRLSNWNSIALRAGLIGVDSNQYLDEKHYVSCTLDINTDGNRTQPINCVLAESLTEELAIICIDILNSGIS